MAHINAWLVAVYVPDYVEWTVCVSVEREWLRQRARWSSVDPDLDLRIVAALPFPSRRDAEKHKGLLLGMSPRARFDAISEMNPDWGNLIDRLDMLAVFRAYEGTDGDEGGTPARLPQAPRDPVLLGEFRHAQAWPTGEPELERVHAALERARILLAGARLGPSLVDPEDELLERLGRT